MSISPLDSDRPPEQPRRRRPGSGRTGKRRRSLDHLGTGDGGREIPVVGDIEVDPYDSYYGRPVVKAPPWRSPIALYLFLGGLAGGAALLATGAQFTGRPAMRRNLRFVILGSVGVGTVALIEDLGRPERFLNMLRVVKVTSPMSLGTWVLSGFGAVSGITTVIEVDRLMGQKLPLGSLRPLLHGMETPAALAQAALGPVLASYTGALLGDTAVPTWAASRRHLSYLFVSSASMAAGGAGMVTAPVEQARPARLLAAAGVVGDIAFLHRMKESMHPLEAEPLDTGTAGARLKWAGRLAVAGGIGTLLGGRHRAFAVAGGAALLASSLLTRFGVLEAGLESVKDPRRVIEPQKARLGARRAAGITDDSITTTC